MSRRDDEGTRRRRVAAVSLARRRTCQWLLLPAAELVVPSSAWAIAARIASTRLWPAQEYTRVILEGPAPIPHQLIVLRDQPRVMLDLDGIELSPELELLPFRLQSSDPYIAAIRLGAAGSNALRIVFELKVETRPQLFALPPVAGFGHRIVLDLYPLTPVDPLMALLDEKRIVTGVDASPSAAPAHPAEAKPQARKSDRRRITVALDPGHGGEDPGAIGQRGTYEKNVALAIARKLKGRI